MSEPSINHKVLTESSNADYKAGWRRIFGDKPRPEPVAGKQIYIDNVGWVGTDEAVKYAPPKAEGPSIKIVAGEFEVVRHLKNKDHNGVPEIHRTNEKSYRHY